MCKICEKIEENVQSDGGGTWTIDTWRGKYNLEVTWGGSYWENGWSGSVEIKYCPWCGKKLSDEEK